MRYFKDANNKPFVFEDNVTQDIISKVEVTHSTTLIEIALAEYEALIAPTFEQLQQAKIAEIKSAFKTATESFTCSNGIVMNSTIDDIDKLQKGYDLAVKNGLTAIDIRDFNNVTHTGVALTDVDTMLLELGNNYASLLSKKWSLLDKVASAATQEDLDAIVW